MGEESADSAATVLVVDDDEDLGTTLAEGLGLVGYDAVWCPSGAAALAALAERDADVVVTDLRMAAMSGTALCERITANRPGTPVLVMTAFGSQEAAVEALRAGAYDFVDKPVDLDDLTTAIKQALQHRDAAARVHRLREAAGIAAAEPFRHLIGSSKPMQQLFDLIERMARSDASVLITGESGTGKELVARELHERSRRSGGPFVAVNCSAIAETLLESQLFGHVKGAFTDARRDQPGLFVQAHGGTLLLDEISEMPLTLQPKLLRALQERRVLPVGGQREVPFDARIVAATNRNLEAEVEARRFREDLYYRLNVVQIDSPPLRRRGDDVLLLATHFVQRFAEQSGKLVRGLSAPAAQLLLLYSWPGNVRELQNCLERAVALTCCEDITIEDLPNKLQRYRTSADGPAAGGAAPEATAEGELLSMEEVERRHIRRVLAATKGNRSAAAKMLGFDRKTLYRKLKRYGLEPEEPR